MPSSTLADFAEIEMGQSPPGDTCNSHGLGLPLLNGPTEYGPNHPSPVQYTTDPRKRARQGDVLFCVRGSTTGRMNWADQEYAIGRGVAAVRHNGGAEVQPYLRAVIEHELPNLLAQATGSTFPNISKGQLGNIPWPDHTPTEQRAIAHILGTLDDKIQLNRQMNETLEEMARALFGSWFVDFDPVRAKMDGRWHPGESLPGLPADLYELFPDRLVESELGEVPEGWEVGTISTVAELNPTSWSRTHTPNSVRYVDLGNTKWGLIDGIVEYRWEQAPTRARRILKPWDTIIGTVRPGNRSYALVMESGLTGSTGFAVLRAADPAYRSFVYLAVTGDRNIDRLSRLAHGAAYPAVRPDVVAGTRVVIPPTDIVSALALRVDALFERVANARRESTVLSGLRDTLLPKLISGELRVPDAERVAERAD